MATETASSKDIAVTQRDFEELREDMSVKPFVESRPCADFHREAHVVNVELSPRSG